MLVNLRRCDSNSLIIRCSANETKNYKIKLMDVVFDRLPRNLSFLLSFHSIFQEHPRDEYFCLLILKQSKLSIHYIISLRVKASRFTTAPTNFNVYISSVLLPETFLTSKLNRFYYNRQTRFISRFV